MSKIFEIRVKLTSPMLGDQRTKDKVRRFDRPSLLNGDIKMDANRWHWLLSQSARSINSSIDPRTIFIEKSMRCPCLELYNRSWMHESQRTGKKTRQSEMFESIRAGAELTFNTIVTDERDPTNNEADLRAPKHDEVEQIFEVIGSMLGISPWGSQFGYGRYNLMHCLPKT